MAFDWLDAIFTLGSVGLLVLAVWGLGRLLTPSMEREQAELARLQAGGERFGWMPGADDRLAPAAERCFEATGTLRRVLTGSYDGRRILMAEYVTGSGSPNNLVAIELPVALPELRISHDAVAPPALLPLEPVLEMSDTESDAFNQRSYVASLDPRYASAILHPRMIEWLLAHPPQDLRLLGNLLVAYTPKPWTVPHTLATVPLLSGFVDRIPPYVLADFALPG